MGRWRHKRYGHVVIPKSMMTITENNGSSTPKSTGFMHPRPRGRTPVNSTWDGKRGRWVKNEEEQKNDLEATTTTATTVVYPKPAGRPPVNCKWDTQKGHWQSLIDGRIIVPKNKPKSVSVVDESGASAETTTAADTTAVTAKRTTAKTTMKSGKAERRIARPRGRPPANAYWDDVEGQWVSSNGDNKNTNKRKRSPALATGRRTKARTKAPPTTLHVVTKKQQTEEAADDDHDQEDIEDNENDQEDNEDEEFNLDEAFWSIPEAKEESTEDVALRNQNQDEIFTLARNDLWSDDVSVINESLLKLIPLVAMADQNTATDTVRAGGEFYRRTAFAAGVPLLVTKLLERYTEEESLQQNGMEFLFRMSLATSSTIDKALLRLGVVERAFWAMNRFPDAPLVQEPCFVMLGNLTGDAAAWDRIKAIYKDTAYDDATNSTDATAASATQHNHGDGRLMALVIRALEKLSADEKTQEAVVFFLERAVSVAAELRDYIQNHHGMLHLLQGLQQRFKAETNVGDRMKSLMAALSVDEQIG